MVGRVRRVGDALIADNAAVMGDVLLGRDVSVWFGVTIRGDDARIEIGDETNVQDNTCVHVDAGAPQRTGRGVTIGHGVVLHGVEVGDWTLIGMNATVLGGVRIGAWSIIGAGAVVQEGMVVPEGSVVLGVPGRIRRMVTEVEREAMRWRARHYVQRALSYLAP
ncbi:MAG: gamma carbonic anhydrase family protein [Planctomycetes bacterium]|nr:gamma carbonic anhydrase family protein [Planctomycetota bacterium]